jgi:hypothetical protein
LCPKVAGNVTEVQVVRRPHCDDSRSGLCQLGVDIYESRMGKRAADETGRYHAWDVEVVEVFARPAEEPLAVQIVGHLGILSIGEPTSRVDPAERVRGDDHPSFNCVRLLFPWS